MASERVDPIDGIPHPFQGSTPFGISNAKKRYYILHNNIKNYYYLIHLYKVKYLSVNFNLLAKIIPMLQKLLIEKL